jgi:hypothetical protein
LPSVALARNVDYDTKKYLDYVTNIEYKICILAQQGRLPETILETEPGVASRGCGANRIAGGSDSDRQAFMAWRGQSLPLPVSHWRKGSVGPQLESATVERRKGSRSHREGPRLTSAGVAPRTRDRRKNECACRRSIHPSMGAMREEAITGTEKNDPTQ